MNAQEIKNSIMDQSRQLIGHELQYLSGRNTFIPEEVQDGRIKGERQDGELSIPLASIELYSRHLARGAPIHVDTVFGASSSHRSALEALVAHLPNAGFLPANRRIGRRNKMVVWFPSPIHPIGELFDATTQWNEFSRSSGNTYLTILNSAVSRSLLTKPFLILTGPSGTGKTRGAVALADSVCGDDCHKLVAVGADWTDNRHVLGYLNPLETDGERRPIYETTPILDLILHANEHPEPHVLILDEMNLSHVERYFADFLSAMELEDKSGALKLHAAETAVTRTGAPIQGSIDFPSNLFVIGTVNIDETTYMFSPKVLDRANVIEIHAEETALGNFLRGIESAGDGPEEKDYGISFLDAAHAIQAEKKEDQEHPQVPPLPETVQNAAADRLMVLFRIMKRGRGEYGFRTGKEVMAYLRTAHFLAGPDSAARNAWATDEKWHEALDAQILQKILPKLHGSRSRLAPLLGALAQYCATGNEAYAMEHFPEEDGSAAKRGLKDACATPSPVFKNSYEKLKRMIDVLVEEQFVSFIC